MPSRPDRRRSHRLVPALEGAEPRLLLSTLNVDDRVPVANTTAYPYSAVVNILVVYSRGKPSGGTGTMVDATHVLTAAHVVYDKARGWPKEVVVMPGQSGETVPLGTYKVNRETLYTDYATHETGGPSRYNYDVALLQLSAPTVPGVGALGQAIEPDAFFRGATLTTSGYPGDLPPGDSPVKGDVMYTATGRTTHADAHIVYYTIPTSGGQSGSPIYTTNATGTYIDAVVSYGEEANPSYKNGAVRITPSLFADLKEWGLVDSGKASPTTRVEVLPHDPTTFQVAIPYTPEALMHVFTT